MSTLFAVRLSAEYENDKPVLKEAAFEMAPGEILGLVGQSGSGKSTLALAMLRLLGMRSGRAWGSIVFRGRELFAMNEGELRKLRGKAIGFVPQSPATALNPNMRLETHLKEAWRAHSDAAPEFRALMESVSLPGEAAFLRRYPGELSVGQGQRFLIALGIMHRPALLITDEPTSALDIVTQSQILGLFAKLRSELNMGILYISHDLLSVANLCDRVAILQAGEIVECGATREIFETPRHPYTQSLIVALPKLEWARQIQES